MFFFLPPFQHLPKVECTQSDQSSADQAENNEHSKCQNTGQ